MATSPEILALSFKRTTWGRSCQVFSANFMVQKSYSIYPQSKGSPIRSSHRRLSHPLRETATKAFVADRPSARTALESKRLHNYSNHANSKTHHMRLFMVRWSLFTDGLILVCKNIGSPVVCELLAATSFEPRPYNYSK
eukprot:1944723-Amphidinium_carterae.1